MIDERTEAQASLYVLGALPPDELREFEAAMRRDLQLQLLVKELRGTAGAMVAAYPQVAPPPGLKQKILQAIDDSPAAGSAPADSVREGSWMFWVPWALAACFAILCVLLISIGHSLRQQAAHLHQELGERNQEAGQLRDQLGQLEARVAEQMTNYQTRIAEVQRQVLQRVEQIQKQAAALTNQFNQQQAETRKQLNFYRDQTENLTRVKKTLEEALEGVTSGEKERLNNARLVVLRPTATGPAGVVGASVWSDHDQRGLLVLENLPPLPANQSYRFWLIDPKLNFPISAGVLPANSTGSVRLQFAPQIRVDTAERFAVSIEPRGGSATPTPGKIVLAN